MKEKITQFVSAHKNIGVLVLGILIVASVAVATTRRGEAPAPEAPVAEEVATETVAAPVSDVTPSFSEVVAMYEGKMLTFGADCKADVAEMVQPAGTTVMLFNESDNARSFMVGDAAYTAGARKYRTAKLATSGSVAVSCDGVKVSTITVQ